MMHHQAYQIGIGGWNVPRFSFPLGREPENDPVVPRVTARCEKISTASGGCRRSMGGFAFSRSESKPRKWWTRKLRERGGGRGGKTRVPLLSDARTYRHPNLCPP